MIRRLTVFLIAIFYSLSIIPDKSSAVTKKIVLGYYTNEPSSAQSFQTNHKFMSQIATDTYTFNSSGKLIGKTPIHIVDLANSNHIRTFAVVSNYGTTDWDSVLARKVLTNAYLKKRFITNLLKLARTQHYKGINIHFEALAPTDRKPFSLFIQELSKTLSANGYLTMVSVAAKEKDVLTDSWSGAYDYKSLGKSANTIQIMTYDETGPWWNIPGSVASKNWLDATLSYAVKVFNPKKILMGIGAYGNDWNTTSKNIADNRQVSLDEISKLLKTTRAVPLRDKSSGSMYFNYIDQNGDTHEVWYDDSTSITQKAHFSVKYNLGGVSIYAIGMEGSGFWHSIETGIN